MDFEWDTAKAKANANKHDVDFETACRVFRDPAFLDRDDDSDPMEPRSNVIGMVNGRLLFVVYTYRGDKIRIISARGAEPYEKRLYHNV